MTRQRVGCVGTGFIAGRHLAALSAIPDVEVVAVADPDKERARAVAERFGGRVYDDGVTLIDSEDLDAVWLCLPPFAHGPAEHAALARDLPFFVEKPLALDLATAASVAAGVRERSLLTAVGYHWRHLDIVDRARCLLADAPAQLVTGRWLDTTPAAPWWSRRAGSGGQLIEQTTHLFDLARVLVGEVDTVTAVESRLARDEWPGADVPTTATAVLRFTSGAIGTISSSCLLGRRHDVGLQLVAEDLLVDVSEDALSDHQLRVATRDGEQVVRSDQDPIASEDAAFVEALQGRAGGVRVPYEEALRTHALVCATDRSARDGTPVEIVTEDG